jgi:hypothetical protein
MATCQSETVNSIPQAPEQDNQSEVRVDLDTLVCRLDSLEDLARYLAMEVQGVGHTETAGSFFSIMNLLEGFKLEARDLVERLMALNGKPSPMRSLRCLP